MEAVKPPLKELWQSLCELAQLWGGMLLLLLIGFSIPYYAVLILLTAALGFWTDYTGVMAMTAGLVGMGFAGNCLRRWM